jgi:hypothetical protein
LSGIQVALHGYTLAAQNPQMVNLFDPHFSFSIQRLRNSHVEIVEQASMTMVMAPVQKSINDSARSAAAGFARHFSFRIAPLSREATLPLKLSFAASDC